MAADAVAETVSPMSTTPHARAPTSKSAVAVLTRPAGRNEALEQHLTTHGVHCVVLPALELTPTTDPAPSPKGFDLVVFVSGFAAQCYFQALPDTGWPDGVLAAGVGPATQQAILDSGLVPRSATLCPAAHTQQDSEALWQTLQTAQVLPQRVLIVRGNTGRNWLHTQWRRAGVQVRDFVAYQRRAAEWSAAAGQQLQETVARGPCILLITSADSARAVDDNLRRLGLIHLWGQCRILAPHPRVAAYVGQLQQAAGVSPGHPIKITKPDTHAMGQSLLALART